MGLTMGVIHWAFPPVTGGVEMHLLTICPEMVRQGAQVIVLCGSAEGQPATETLNGVIVERRDGMVPALIEELEAGGGDVYGRSRAMFETFLDQHQVDVVQGHNLHLDFFDLSRALEDACKEREIPVYLVLHNDVFIDRSEETMERVVQAIDWDRLVAISETIRESMSARLPSIARPNWTVIMHGIDIETFYPATEQRRRELKVSYGFEGRSVILHPGRFLPWKGILPAVQSMPMVIKKLPEALMVFTGRAKRIYKDQDELATYDARIDRFIEEHDLRDHVHIGTYDHDDIPRLTALSEVVIYTTIGEEPFGLVPVEAMACGVPVVVTRSGGLTESVLDGETGFIITKDEEKLPEELADRLLQILASDALVLELGRRGRARAEKAFDKSRMARDFIDLSEELIEK